MPVEAVKNHCPVITSDIRIFSEVGSFIKVNYDDPSNLMNEISFLLNQDVESRKELVSKQFESIKRHNFQTYESNLIDNLNKVEYKKSLIGRLLY